MQVKSRYQKISTRVRFELTRAEPNSLPTLPVVHIAGHRLNRSAILSTTSVRKENFASLEPLLHTLHERVITIFGKLIVVLTGRFSCLESVSPLFFSRGFRNGLFRVHWR